MKRKIKFTPIILFFITSSLGFSQTDRAIISLIDQNILYADYTNELVIGNNAGISDFRIESKNIQIWKSILTNEKNSYTFICEEIGNQQVYFINNKTNDTFDIITFKFEPMPIPKLYYGLVEDGDKIKFKYLTSINLSVYYPEYIPLIAKFKVEKWEFSISGDSVKYTGKGKEISKKAMKAINNAPSGSELKISCTYSYKGFSKKYFNSSSSTFLL